MILKFEGMLDLVFSFYYYFYTVILEKINWEIIFQQIQLGPTPPHMNMIIGFNKNTQRLTVKNPHRLGGFGGVSS